MLYKAEHDIFRKRGLPKVTPYTLPHVLMVPHVINDHSNAAYAPDFSSICVICSLRFALEQFVPWGCQMVSARAKKGMKQGSSPRCSEVCDHRR